jgi:aryl-alcohol dehydrogenase-like predicted oxidoreductase
MNHVRLGPTGLTVSRLCLGTANFGWQLGPEGAAAVFAAATVAGITFLDTADAYPGAEDILGAMLKGRRDQYIVATKGGGPTGAGAAWEVGTSRKHLLDAIDRSLQRLGTDYVDLYFPHLYDAHTPHEETLSALDAMVRSGRTRYIGLSNYAAYQVARAVGITELRQLAPITSVQARYNLISREIERDLGPLCQEERIGILAYNPLAGGLLTGKHDRNAEPTAETRFGAAAGPFGAAYRGRYWHPDRFDTVDALKMVASRAGLELPSLATAWVSAQPIVNCVIVGASRPEQVVQSAAALDLDLPPDVLLDVSTTTDRWRHVA